MADPALLPTLTGRHHALVKLCRELAHGPRSDGRVLLDGAHLVVDALAAGAAVECILATRAALDAEPALARAMAAVRGLTVYEASESVIDAASPARTPSGVQDPGNVGGVIRSADALGATGAIAAGPSADPGNWKALRGSMGSLFRMPVARGDLRGAISEARRRRVSIVAAVPRDGRDPAEVEFEKATLLIVGGEGAGLDAEVVASADERVSIPMRRGVESLNVGVAAALVLDAARRRRVVSRQP